MEEERAKPAAMGPPSAPDDGTPGASFFGKAQLLRRNWRFLVAWPSMGALGMAALYAAPYLPGLTAALAGLFGLVAVIAAPFLILHTWLANPRPLRQEGDLVAGPAGIFFGGRLLLGRRAIRGGFTLPHPDGALVQLERRFLRPVELLLPTAEEGRRALKSLGLDVSQSIATVPLRSLAAIDWRRFLPGAGVFGLLFAPVALGAVMESRIAALVVAVASVLTLLSGIALLAINGRATVGADGVLVTHLYRKRFYSYTDIARVQIAYHGIHTVALVLKSARNVHLPLPRDWSHDQERAAAQRLKERIETAMAERRTAPGEADLAALARKGRPARAWLAHLRTIGAGANADHRSAPVPADRLWRIVEDSTLGAEARAAAAVALGSAQGEEARDRLRAVAQNTAAPKLRIALEAAAGAAEADAEEEAIAALQRVVER